MHMIIGRAHGVPTAVEEQRHIGTASAGRTHSNVGRVGNLLNLNLVIQGPWYARYRSEKDRDTCPGSVEDRSIFSESKAMSS